MGGDDGATATAAATGRSTSRDGALFGTLAAITVVTAVVSSLGAPLVPSIARTHHVSLADAQWILTATLVTAAAATPALGRWGSGRLRRPVILTALAAVLVGTVLSALADALTGFGGLVVGRALQGVGLGVTPLALAVARDVWRGERLVSRLSLLSVATVGGAGLGYPLTGALAGWVGVSGAYAVGGGLVAATLALAARFLPRDADGVPQPVDVPSALLVGLGVTGVLLAVSQGERRGWTSSPVLAGVLVGALLLAAWVARTVALERRGGQPLVDLRLALTPGLRGVHLFTLALGVAMYTLLTLVVLLVRADGSAGWGLGMGVAVAGSVLVPYALLSVSGSRLAIRVSRRFAPALLLPIGGLVFASSLVLLGLAHDRLWQALLAMALGGLGSGFTFSSLPALIVPFVPVAETGSALALNMLLRYVGFATGSAAALAVLDVLGGDGPAFTTTCLLTAGLCTVAAAGALLRVDRA